MTSCYFNFNTATTIIKRIRDNGIRIGSVYIYIDRKNAIYNINKYNTLLSDYNKIIDEYENQSYEFKIYAINSNELMHSKIYALVPHNDIETRGRLVIGSANLTPKGFTSRRNGNIETISYTDDASILDEFIESIDNFSKIKVDLNDVLKFNNSEDVSFRYAIIMNGSFYHKWNYSLNQELTLRLALSEDGVKELNSPVFKEHGFIIDQATISKSYFQFDNIKSNNQDFLNLLSSLKIESYLGSWIPKSVITCYKKSHEFEKYKKEVLTAIDKQYNRVVGEINEDMQYLLDNNYLANNDINMIEKLNEKISMLKDDETDYRLYKIYNKFELFDFPYDIGDIDSINSVFESLFEEAKSKRSKNKTVKAFIEACDHPECMVDIFEEYESSLIE